MGRGSKQAAWGKGQVRGDTASPLPSPAFPPLPGSLLDLGTWTLAGEFSWGGSGTLWTYEKGHQVWICARGEKEEMSLEMVLFRQGK